MSAASGLIFLTNHVLMVWPATRVRLSRSEQLPASVRQAAGHAIAAATRVTR